MSLIATASILVLLIIIVILFLFHLEQVKYTKRLEDRIGLLSSRIRNMNNKELDTVLRSSKYKKERDELYKLIDDMYNTLEVGEGRTYLFPRAYSDNPNKLKAHRWEDVYLASPSYYSYNPSQANTQTDSNTPSQDSSSYSGGGGDFSGGGSGGSWD